MHFFISGPTVGGARHACLHCTTSTSTSTHSALQQAGEPFLPFVLANHDRAIFVE
jgi:hypothetical protein